MAVHVDALVNAMMTATVAALRTLSSDRHTFHMRRRRTMPRMGVAGNCWKRYDGSVLVCGDFNVKLIGGGDRAKFGGWSDAPDHSGTEAGRIVWMGSGSLLGLPAGCGHGGGEGIVRAVPGETAHLQGAGSGWIGRR